MGTTYEYYGRYPSGGARADPVGVIRRRRLRNGVAVDQAFTRNLRWERSDALYQVDLGYSDATFERITDAEAEAFVRRVTARLGGDPDEAWTSPDDGPFDPPSRVRTLVTRLRGGHRGTANP